MAAAAEAVMSEFSWSDEDHREESAAVKQGRLLLERWARWQRASGVYLDFPPWSTVVPLSGDDEPQAGARHVAAMPTDDEAMRVDRVVALWKARRTRYWKLIRVEYMTGGSGEQKARRCGFRSRTEYRRTLERVQAIVADIVASGGQ